jgi:mRNA interferase HigB
MWELGGVRVISQRRMLEFGARFPKAAEPLKHWANAVRSAGWKNPGALKADFGSADFVGDLTVFNVGGNRYRLIAFVHYLRQIVFIKHIFTHEEYDQGDWKL